MEELIIKSPQEQLADKYIANKDLNALKNMLADGNFGSKLERKIETTIEKLEAESSEKDTKIENKEAFKSRIIETAKGSRYRYLEDGRTQRFKTIEGKEYDPQDLLVFVPSYEWVLQNNPKWIEERSLQSRTYYEQYILDYVQPGADRTKKIWVVDLAGNKIETNEAAKNAGKIFLAFGEEGKPVTDMIPVSKEPIKGFYTYDSRVYENEQGERMRERHMGNQVVDIKDL